MVGVLTWSESGTRCLTCRYGKTSCQHVKTLVGIINTQLDEDIPDFLHPFLDEATATAVSKTRKGKVLVWCHSKRYHLTSQPHLLKRPFNERFLVMENTCYLRDVAPTINCANCGNGTILLYIYLCIYVSSLLIP